MGALNRHKEGDRALSVESSIGWKINHTQPPRNPGVTPAERPNGQCRCKSLIGMVGRE